MAIKTKVPLRKESFMKTLVLFYAYVFFNQVGMNIKKDVLSSKLLLSLVQIIGSPFPLEQRLHKYETRLSRPL